MLRHLRLASTVLIFAALAASCGDDAATTGGQTDPGVEFVLDLSADLHDPTHFYDVPYPSDLRLDADGHPDLAGFPNPAEVKTVADLVGEATSGKGFSVLPVAYLRFDGALGARVPSDVVAADAASPILLLDVDPASPERGRLYPVIAETLAVDQYTSDNVLAVATRPGFVLRSGTKYAAVVMASANDAEGKPLHPNDLLGRIMSGGAPGAGEEAAFSLYADLLGALDLAGVDRAQVAGATVFTTARVVEETAALGDAVVDAYDVVLEDLAIDPANVYPELCLLRGKVTLPQFQVGTPPYDTGGLFEIGDDGLPTQQRTEDAPFAIVIPRTPMPEAGYPLVLNVHGSGGFSIAMVRPVADDGLPGDPIGPAFPYATKGIGMAGIAMPVNPERLPGAEETEYLNVNNMPAIRDTFRQGILDARLFLEAVKKVEIDPAILSTCTGATLPAGQTAFHFDPANVMLTGQSMGGMYTNLIGATDPSIRAAVPTGAGGHWTFFIFVTGVRDGNIPAFLQLLLGTQAKLSHLHPVLSVGAAALEPADPIVYMPRLARRPLPGHPVRPIYEPVGQFDSYFPTVVYDAVALAYGHQEAGDEVWPEMQEALALDGRDGIIGLPATDNLDSEAGGKYTGVVQQFVADGPYDPHAIYSHRDDVKRQYACFLDTFVRTGKATVVPAEPGWHDPCP
jgi:hypothetical protein